MDIARLQSRLLYDTELSETVKRQAKAAGRLVRGALPGDTRPITGEGVCEWL